MVDISTRRRLLPIFLPSFFKGSPEQSYHWFCGDLKFGRTVHSLIEALVRYTGIKIVLISPEELRLPDYIRDDVLRANNVPFEEVIKMEDVLPKLDVLYMTRVQKERFFNEDDYIRMRISIFWISPKWILLLRKCWFCIRCRVSMRSPLTWITTRALLTLNRFSTVFMHVWP